MYVIQDEVFQYVNVTFAGMLGYTPDEMTGMHLRQAVVPGNAGGKPCQFPSKDQRRDAQHPLHDHRQTPEW
ncbi:MAG: PAS domain S-box protein [Dechloromonas sp.]|uniref:PAS domain S-box protein n=1 Tax=Candidatus Dechloromonas phosphorivorans TaxID=2899244 RepID=A0A935K171_9RHOO|nr:PAS domain S-box protein [Candidatus Dechloromonas phosphorivorans]